MNTRPPLASLFFYALAALTALYSLVVIAGGIFGTGVPIGPGLGGELVKLVRGAVVLIGLGYLVSAGGLVAVGAVIHDIRRIAENTAVMASRKPLTASTFPFGSFQSGAKDEPVFFYFEEGVERGPISKTDLAALIGSGRVNPFQRIEKSVGGVRRPFEQSDLT